MKRTLLALPLALSFASAAFAAPDPIEKQVQVTAVVPTAAFYVEPVGSDWMNDPQELPWNPTRATFGEIRHQVQAKSTVGSISGYLLNAPVLTSGLDTIDLNVKVGATDLDITPNEILTAAQALPGAVMDFVITAKNPANGSFTPGNYQGLVSMMFETAP
ncbi:CS1 type fimbrial major subunit [Pseudomonas sp. RP23018S]|uniref:CS1 type fimbrial major subunit n=1 Tax=Pseudomonas sp. RP23018S TaxID=3096037 RepID=UPI002ACA906D|nr:CS1 type fimbrial major subunit [Pseudomonas sp. RP23018S]MDZ5602073.1 CS1 type fimbrial major subunit [Pseudomonas sp. RP23018S]